MTLTMFRTQSEAPRRSRIGSRAAAGVLLAALVTPSPARAFFQQTTLEGSIGTDIGGVWLIVHNIMPEFRVTFPKPASGPPVPLEVGPLTTEVELLMGKGRGVVVTRCIDEGFCAGNGVMVGDVLLQVGSTELTDVASFQKALENPPQTMFLSIRRPALKMSTTRLLKVKYQATPEEADGTLAAKESLDLRVLDLALPFADEVEKTRQSHVLFQPSEGDLEKLGASWFELPPSDPLMFVSAKHRFASRAAFDESLAGDKALTEAKYAILMDLGGNPVRGSGKTIDLYGVETLEQKKIEGNYVTVTIANAPFPINIEFKGRFQMTRVADWSDQDDKARAAREAARKPKEDLNKYETLPEVPAPGKPAGAGAAPAEPAK